MNERLLAVKEQIRAFAEDAFTVPNGITLGRLALSPLVANRLYKDPGTWPEAAAFLATDNVDGLFARLGDRSELLATLGFRKSELGRLADPATDVIVTGQMIIAGTRNGVIPKWLAGAALTQKAVKSYHAVSATRHGAEVQVSMLGKRSEFATNLGIGLLFAAEQIEDEDRREQARRACISLAVTGIAGAFAADRGYVSQARQQTA